MRVTGGPSYRTAQRFADLARRYTAIAQDLSGRTGLAVRVADLGAGPSAPASVTDFATETVVLNGTFLKATATPEMIDDALYDAVLNGLLRRELGRLDHSMRGAGTGAGLNLVTAVALLDEVRVEARVIAERPQDAPFMAAAASVLNVAPLDPAHFNASFRTFSAATLSLGRVHAGSLQSDELAELTEQFRVALGDEVFDALSLLLSELVAIEDDDVDALIDAAMRFLDLVGLGGGFDDARRSASRDTAGSGAADGAPASAAERRAIEAVRERLARTETARRDGGVRPTAPEPGGDPETGLAEQGPVPITIRPPTEAELIERNDMIRTFRSARFRDREMTKVASRLPPGRLRVSGLVQFEAALASGALDSRAAMFERKRHRHVDEPVLSVGIAVDTSGSMSGKERVVSSALYTLASAVSHAGGVVSLAAFGERLQVLSTPTAPLSGVPLLEMRGGTQFSAEAIAAVAHASFLYSERHVRQLYVLSDGAWSDKDESEALLAGLDRAGCAVFVIDMGQSPPEVATGELVAIKDVRALGAELSRRFATSFRRAR